jgi:hypothetical protein
MVGPEEVKRTFLFNWIGCKIPLHRPIESICVLVALPSQDSAMFTGE